MGFDAIWISPIVKNIEDTTAYGDAYHGYWAQDITSLNSHFGTSGDLKALSAALHARGMYLMVDVVVNHMAYNAKGSIDNIDYTKFRPFNKKSNYHFPYCTIDYNNLANMTQIHDCWIGDTQVPLPDLRTEDPVVQLGYAAWIANLIPQYGIDGIRLDTVLQVNTGFWSTFLAAANTYMFGEVYINDASFVCSYQNYLPGVLNYGLYFALFNAFKSTTTAPTTAMTDLATAVNNVKSKCKDTSLLGTFSENHDNPRFAFVQGDLAAAMNLISFTMLADGIPIIYQGQEQRYSASGSNNGGNDPFNREAIWFSQYNIAAPLYGLIKKLNWARRNAIKDDSTYLSYQSWPIYTDATTIATKKGKLVTVTSNKGSTGANYTQVIPAGYTAGTVVTELLGCTTLTADSSGSIAVPMGLGQPRVYYPTANKGSQCGGATTRIRSSTPSISTLKRLVRRKR
ncbi:hypothetical protein LTR95_008339 [Oleoguttula sp. CCFEE 5521]